MRENCRPKKRQPDTTRIASQVVRPVMGSVRSRFFTRLHAKTPIRPPKIPPNSFVQRILPVTPTRSTGCAQIPAIFMETRNFGGGGRGTPEVSHVPFWHHGSHQFLLRRLNGLVGRWPINLWHPGSRQRRILFRVAARDMTAS